MTVYEVRASDGTFLALRYDFNAALRAAYEFLNRWPPFVYVHTVVGEGR